MEITKEKITTISKEAFEKLSQSEKQILIVNDALARVKSNQFTVNIGNFCRFNNYIDTPQSLSELLKKPKLGCVVCAKGGLFLSYIGVVNDYIVKGNIFGESIQSEEMELLSEVFSEKQLSLIETAFERCYYDWNVVLTLEEKDKCIEFGAGKDSLERFEAICNNMLANNGEFIP